MTQELTARIIFVLYAVIILGGGVMAVYSASLVRALIGLILTLFGVAGMYLLMNAPFIALMQLLIYVGAVTVLIFFAIMLTRAKGGPMGSEGEEKQYFLYYKRGKTYLALLGALVPAALLGWICVTLPPASKTVPEETGIDVLGKALLNDYVLAFELISVVLFVAMAGAVLLGYERRKGK